MNMKRVILLLIFTGLIYSCGSNDRGELVGIKNKHKWYSEKPYGMVLIPGGSFTMGKQDEDVRGDLNTPPRTVTVRPYYMDETEITNSEYKMFVHWVRDSIALTLLGEVNEEEYLILTDQYGREVDEPSINWEAEIPWETEDEDVTDALEMLYLANLFSILFYLEIRTNCGSIKPRKRDKKEKEKL